MTESSPNCLRCGARLKPDAPEGLCPNCLMALNLATETVFTDDSPAAKPPLPAEQIAPHFPQLEILECLGRGGMGVVYKARQKTLNRVVALKLLAPERVNNAQFAERFAREAQALAALSHPNIVTIHDFGQAGGFYYLLMEYVEGVNLRQLLRVRKFTPEEALGIVPPLCEALQFAHDRGIVHRDIKPENLLIDKFGRVKIADFGIAKMLGGNGGDRGETAAPDSTTQSAVGTRGYSAPEQQTSPQRVDSRADIYSLGVVFYELLTGELPGRKLEPPSKKVQIDVRLDAVVLRALEKTPELRWQTAEELRTQIETIATTSAASSQNPSPRPGDDWQTSEIRNGKSGARRVPWQIWVIIAYLGLEGVGNLISIPQQPQALVWLLAKVLFITGLLRRWRPVFVLVLIVSAQHAAYFLPSAPIAALINLALLALLVSTLRFYFVSAEPTTLPAGPQRARLSPVFLTGAAIVLGLGLGTTGWLYSVTEMPGPTPPVDPAELRMYADAGSAIESAFEPQREVSLRSFDLDGENRFLDIDSGKVKSPPGEFRNWSSERRQEWLREQGVDLMILVSGMKITWELLTPVDHEATFTKVPRASWTDAREVFRTERKPEPGSAIQHQHVGLELHQITQEGRPTHPDNVYMFETVDGSRGLLRISGLVFDRHGDPNGLKIQFKRFNQTLSNSRPAAMSTVPFGPEVEVTLNDMDDGRGSEMLDLDAGKAFNLDRSFDRWSQEQQMRWIEESGADLMVDQARQQWGLITLKGNEARLVLVTNQVWRGLGREQFERELARSHPDIQTESLREGTVYVLGTNPVPPLTFAFTTAKGARGLLQVTELAQNPNRIKLRFKTAAGSAPSSMVAAVKTPSIPQKIDFKFVRVEAPKDSHRIELHFERDNNYGLGIEVTQNALPGPNGEHIPVDFWLNYGRQSKWVGVNQPNVLVWRLPAELNEDEIKAGAKELERNARRWTHLNDGANPEFAHIKHREGWTYVLWSHILREPELRPEPATPARPSLKPIPIEVIQLKDEMKALVEGSTLSASDTNAMIAFQKRELTPRIKRIEDLIPGTALEPLWQQHLLHARELQDAIKSNDTAKIKECQDQIKAVGLQMDKLIEAARASGSGR